LTTREICRRLDALEAAAARMLDPDDFEPLKWLTCRELQRLEHAYEAGGGLAEAMWPDMHRRALSRAMLDVNMDALQRREDGGKLLLAFDDPERPGEKRFVNAIEDAAMPDRWHLDVGVVRWWPDLPAELGAAEVERPAVDSWRPGAARAR
jgi:hypothetical protein